MSRVLITYKPSRPTRSLELGKDPATGKARRRMFRAASTRIVDQVEAAAIKGAASAAGILADFAFQALQDAAEVATGLDLPEAEIKGKVTEAVAKALDPDGDGHLGKAKAKGKAKPDTVAG